MDKKYMIVCITLILVLFTFSFVIVYAANNETLIVDANIIGNPEEVPEINIEISPNQISFGDVEVGQESDAVRINITNKGNTAINVFPELKNDDEVFDNLYFQKRKTGNSSTEYQIGEFVLNIAEPTSDSGKAEYCYVKLNLEDINPEDLDESSFGNEDAEIVFIALAA